MRSPGPAAAAAFAPAPATLVAVLILAAVVIRRRTLARFGRVAFPRRILIPFTRAPRFGLAPVSPVPPVRATPPPPRAPFALVVRFLALLDIGLDFLVFVLVLDDCRGRLGADRAQNRIAFARGFRP